VFMIALIQTVGGYHGMQHGPCRPAGRRWGGALSWFHQQILPVVLLLAVSGVAFLWTRRRRGRRSTRDDAGRPDGD
jgi:hypothetical protein